MKLSTYYQEATPTREAFLELLKFRWRDPEAFDTFVHRMNKEGGYGALR